MNECASRKLTQTKNSVWHFIFASTKMSLSFFISFENDVTQRMNLRDCVAYRIVGDCDLLEISLSFFFFGKMKGCQTPDIHIDCFILSASMTGRVKIDTTEFCRFLLFLAQQKLEMSSFYCSIIDNAC